MQAPRELEPLWYSRYWDGPIDGVVLYRGTLCWFRLNEELTSQEAHDEDVQPLGVFEIFEMTDAELRQVVTQHLRFERYVGCHTCYHITADGSKNAQLQWWDKFGSSPADSPFYEGWAERPNPNPPAVSTEGKEVLARFSGREFLPRHS